MTEMTMQQRLDRLDSMRVGGKLIRKQWTEGQEYACLLAALSPEAGSKESASACPAEVMPPWLAELTPWIDDSGSDAAWPGVIARYADVAHRWHSLTPETWTRLDYAARAICVREAMSHATHEGVLVACRAVLDLCVRASNGDVSDRARAEAEAAEAAAWAARAEARAAAEAEAAEAAAWAAEAAAAAEAAEAAAWAARAWAWAEAGARAEAEAAEAAAWAARAEACDRMHDAILSTIEKACDEAEAA